MLSQNWACELDPYPDLLDALEPFFRHVKLLYPDATIIYRPGQFFNKVYQGSMPRVVMVDRASIDTLLRVFSPARVHVWDVFAIQEEFEFAETQLAETHSSPCPQHLQAHSHSELVRVENQVLMHLMINLLKTGRDR